VRVVIGEDETLMRSGLALVLTRGGLDVVGEAVDADELQAVTAELKPDVVVTDIRMPPTYTDDGLRAAIAIRASLRDVGVLVLSQHVQRRYAFDLIGEQPRGVGYLLKQRVANVEQFCRDVRRVGYGETVLDPDVVTTMVDRARRDLASVDRLTPRQLEVLALIAAGHSNAAIARQLYISERAVVRHTSLIYDQLGLPVSDDHHRRVLAVIRYLAR
jgi:DNA-binding NarL/FixJ family response regulator